eukprot:scaffold8635_cov32-Phaeocystis_antarctica.AAC.3
MPDVKHYARCVGDVGWADERQQTLAEGAHVFHHRGRDLAEVAGAVPREAVEHDAISAADDGAVIEAHLGHDVAPRGPREARVSEEERVAEAHIGKGAHGEARGVVDAADPLAERQRR